MLRSKIAQLKLIKPYVLNKWYGFLTNQTVRKNSPKYIRDYREFLNIYFSKELKDKFTITTKDGIKVQGYQTDINSIAEVFVSRDYLKSKDIQIKKGDIVFDIGAHIGCFSLLAASMGATVFAFEPNPDSFKKLQHNIKLNNLSRKIKALNFGIADKNGLLEFSQEGSNSAGNSIYSNSAEKIKLPVKTFDTVCKELKINKINLMKLDTEGSEYKILPRLESKYYQIIMKIVGEYHLFPQYNELNYTYIKKILRPHFHKIRRYSPYYFVAIK